MLIRVNLYFHSQDPEDPVERWLLSLPPYRRGPLIKRHLYALAVRGQLSRLASRVSPADSRKAAATRAVRRLPAHRGPAATAPALALDQINRVMRRVPLKP